MRTTPAAIRSQVEQLARELYELRRAIWTTPPEWREASASSFPALDLGFYDRATRELEAEGFRRLGDWENVTHSRLAPEQQTFVRSFLSEDGTISASVWHARTLGRSRLTSLLLGSTRATVRAVVLSSEFDDGTFLSTNNLKGQDGNHAVPGIEVQRLGQQAPVASLVAVHRAAIVERAAAGVSPLCANDVDDVRASGLRAHARIAAHCARVGYFANVDDLAHWREHLSPDVHRMLLGELAKLDESGRPS